MTELFQAALSAENIIYTLLLVLVLFYWLSVIAGGLDMNAFDIDLDVDADLDVDLDTDVDVDEIKKGEEALVLRPSKDASYYLIRKPTEIVF